MTILYVDNSVNYDSYDLRVVFVNDITKNEHYKKFRKKKIYPMLQINLNFYLNVSEQALSQYLKPVIVAHVEEKEEYSYPTLEQNPQSFESVVIPVPGTTESPEIEPEPTPVFPTTKKGKK